MSSHHIVRDEQEPALLILNPGSLPLENVQQLLEWSPTVIVAESALEKVLEWGVKIDVVLCRQEQVPKLVQQLSAQAPVKFLGHSPQDESPVLNAFYFLSANKHKAVNIVADLEQQDTVFFSSLAQIRSQMEVVVYSRNRKCLMIERQFEKWLPEGEELLLAPLDADCMLSTEGFEQQLEKHPLNEGLTLKAKSDGKIRLESNEKAFWLCENLS